MISRSTTLAAVAATILIAAGTARAQVYGLDTSSVNAGHYGASVAAWRDIDGNGRMDYLVGAPDNNSGNGRIDGLYHDGTSYFGVASGVPMAFGSAILGSVDLTGDGVNDIVVGAPTYDPGAGPSGRVYAFDGVTQLVLWSAAGSAVERLGSSLASVGDWNTDGINDIAVGAPYADDNVATPPVTGVGAVYILNGANGAILNTYMLATVQDSRFGTKIETLFANLDSDLDLAISAVSPTGAGTVYFYDRTQLTLNIVGTAALDAFGSALANVGDVDGDLIDDLAIGSPGAGLAGEGRVYLYSPGTTTTLFTLSGAVTNGALGSALASFADVNADSERDLAIGQPNDTFGSVIIASGANLSVIRTFDGVNFGVTAGARFGAAIADAGNINNFGLADILVGAPLETTNATGGLVSVISVNALSSAGSTAIGQSCPSFSPSSITIGAPILGTNPAIFGTSAQANTAYGVFFSVGASQTYDHGNGCIVHLDATNPTTNVFEIALGTTDIMGIFIVPLALVNEPFWAGETLTIQAAIINSGNFMGVDLTNALEIVLGY